MSFYINENSIRGGNRGGRNLFSWEDAKILNNKDRECFLGLSDKLGYLDKRCRWIKNDWYMKNLKKTHYKLTMEEEEQLEQELTKIKEQDKNELNEALGIKKNEHQKRNLTTYDFKKMFGKEEERNNDKTESKEYLSEDDFERKGLGIQKRKEAIVNKGNEGESINLHKLQGKNELNKLSNNSEVTEYNSNNKEDSSELLVDRNINNEAIINNKSNLLDNKSKLKVKPKQSQKTKSNKEDELINCYMDKYLNKH